MSGREREGAPKVFGERPAGAKAQEGIGSSAGLNTSSKTTDRRSDQGPEGGPARLGAAEATRWQRDAGNGTRARPADEAGRLSGGASPWRANPGRGCGMKQAHEGRGGASRRGREKRRGRNSGRPWEACRWWTPQPDVAMGSVEPQGRCSLPPGSGRVCNREHSEGEAKLTRG